MHSPARPQPESVDLIRGSNWRIRRLTQYVTDHMSEALCLQKAAKICALERTYFCRFFYAQTGIHFSDWHRDIRIRAAKGFLLEGLRLKEVAAAVGYSEVTTFKRHFVKCEKMSPAQYRRLHRQKPTNREPQWLLTNRQ